MIRLLAFLVALFAVPAAAQVGTIDTTLNDVSDLLQQAQDLASANVGDDITQDERNNAAVVAKSLYQQLVTLGNKSQDGSYLFAGDKLDKAPFEEFAGGVRFVGSEKTLARAVRPRRRNALGDSVSPSSSRTAAIMGLRCRAS